MTHPYPSLLIHLDTPHTQRVIKHRKPKLVSVFYTSTPDPPPTILAYLEKAV